jgi:hypothetical protein
LGAPRLSRGRAFRYKPATRFEWSSWREAHPCGLSASIPGPRVGVIARNPETLGMTKQSLQTIVNRNNWKNSEARRLLRPRLSFLQTRPRNNENTIVSSIVSHGTGMRASRGRCELCELLAPSPCGRRCLTCTTGLKIKSAPATKLNRLYTENSGLLRHSFRSASFAPRNDVHTKKFNP